MALPLSRNTTYTTDSPVKSADLNDLQDKAIDAWNGKHGDKTQNIPLHTGFTADPTDWTASVSQWTSLVGAPAALFWQLPLCNGDRLREIRGIYNLAAGTYCRLDLLYTIAAVGSEASPFAFTVPKTVSGNVTTFGELVLDCDDLVIGSPSEAPTFAIQTLIVSFATDGIGNLIGQLKYTFDHP